MKKKLVSLCLSIVMLLMAVTILLLLFQGREDKDRSHIIFISKNKNTETDFWLCLFDGIQTAAKEYHVDLDIMSVDIETDYEGQNALILEAIKENPDAIILCPADYTKTCEAAEKITEQKIPLIMIDSALEKEIGESLIATDNYEAGYKVGEYAKSYIDKNTCIALISHVEGSSTAIERIEGIKAGLNEAKDQIREIVYCDSDTEKAYRITEELIDKYSEVSVMIATNENSAVGAARAIKDRNLGDSIRLFGFDSSHEQIQLLEEEIYDATAVQKAFNMGYLSLDTAVRVIRGEKVDTFINSGSELITAQNMYTTENQKLLFPFGQ